MRLLIVPIAASIGFLGCASIFTGTSDTIHIRSEEPDTKLFVDGKLVGKNSATYVLPRKGDHVVEAVKPGCGTATYPVPYSFNAVTLLGVFLDLGIVSILVVDGLATGAAMKVSNPTIVLTPDCRRSGG